MTDLGRLYTEREKVLAEREAYKDGAAMERGHGHDSGGWASEAARRYPLPKVTRERLLKDEYGFEWRVRGGCAEWRMDENHAWEEKLHVRGGMSLSITKVRAAVIAALFDNPTVEVEDDS